MRQLPSLSWCRSSELFIMGGVETEDLMNPPQEEEVKRQYLTSRVTVHRDWMGFRRHSFKNVGRLSGRISLMQWVSSSGEPSYHATSWLPQSSLSQRRKQRGHGRITKILTARLSPLLPMVISPNHSGFIKGRLLNDNSLLAQEMFHELPKFSPAPNVALKLDLPKA